MQGSRHRKKIADTQCIPVDYFQCCMLDEFICHLGVSGVFVAFILFLMENPVSKQCRPSSDATFFGRVHLSFRVSDLFCRIYYILLANNVDPDKTPHFVAIYPGRHCLPMALFRVSR